MNVFFYSSALLLLCSFLCTEAIFSGGTVTISAGGLLLAGLAVKAIAGVGLLAASRGGRGGGKSRHGRSVPASNDLSEILSQASIEDEGDCAKKFVCEVHAKAFAALDEVEQGVYALFGAAETLDVARETVQFDLAAMVGQKAGYEQCQKVYARCDMNTNELKAALRR